MTLRTGLRRITVATIALVAVAVVVSTWTWVLRLRRAPIGRRIMASRTLWASPPEVPRVRSARIGAENADGDWMGVATGVHGIWDFSHDSRRLCLVEGHVVHPAEQLVFEMFGTSLRRGGPASVLYFDATPRLQVRDGEVWREFRRVEPTRLERR